MTMVIMPKGPVKFDHRRRIAVPEGDTVESLVRFAMCSDKGRNAHKIIGLHYDTYRFVRKLLLLRDQPALSEYELALVKKSIDSINTTQRVAEAKKLTAGILKRHWSGKTRDGRTRKQREVDARLRQRFDKLLFMIKEICTNNDEIELPLLRTEEKTDAINDVIESIAGLSNLITKLQNGTGGKS